MALDRLQIEVQLINAKPDDSVSPLLDLQIFPYNNNKNTIITKAAEKDAVIENYNVKIQLGLTFLSVIFTITVL